MLSPKWATTTDAYGWSNLFQGMRLNPYTGLYHTLNREYNTQPRNGGYGRPGGVCGWSSLYQFVVSSPVNFTDFLGLKIPWENK